MARGERTSWQALSTWCCSPATSSSFSNHERTGLASLGCYLLGVTIACHGFPDASGRTGRVLYAICQCMLSEDNGFKRLKPEAETLLTGLVRPVKDYRHPRESEAPEHPQGACGPLIPAFRGNDGR